MMLFVGGFLVGGLFGVVLVCAVVAGQREDDATRKVARQHADAVALKRALRSSSLYKVGR